MDLPTPSPCPNCGAPLAGPYCAQCGQRDPALDKPTLQRFFRDALSDYFGVDGKVWVTLRTLILVPGQLTRDHLEGRRVRYVRPFQLFLLVNVVFLVAAVSQGIYDYTLQEYLDFTPPDTELTRAWVADALEDSGLSYAVYEERFNAVGNDLRKGLIILLVPLFAVVSWLRYLRSRPRVQDHLVFSVHLFAFYWLFVAIVDRPIVIALELAGIFADPVLHWINMSALLTYMTLALRRVHAQSWAVTIATGLALTWVVRFLLRSYRIWLFFSTYWMV